MIVKAHGRRIGEVLLGFLAALSLVFASGCGGSIYAITASGASAKLEQAEALGAERYAPYEYWYAKEHLTKAAEEASTADYGDAITFASTADEYAEKAIALSRQAHQGSGR